MISAVELGVIYGIMALGVFLTFRVLNFADLTVDGSFTTGAATAAVAILAGWNPFLAIAAGFGTGFLAGIITGLLHTKGKIDGLLAGILTQIGLWSVNLRIMDSANVPLLRADTVFTPMREAGPRRNDVRCPRRCLSTWLPTARGRCAPGAATFPGM